MKKLVFAAFAAAIVLCATAPAVAQVQDMATTWKVSNADQRLQFGRMYCNDSQWPAKESPETAKTQLAKLSWDQARRNELAYCADKLGVSPLPPDNRATKANHVPGGASVIYRDGRRTYGGNVHSGVPYGHGRRPYQGDEELLELQSLGPRGRVIKHRPAPAGAIPCIVRGVRGKCVLR